MTTPKNTKSNKSKNLHSDLDGPKHIVPSTRPENTWQLSSKKKNSATATPTKMPVLKIEPTPTSNSYDLLSETQETQESDSTKLISDNPTHLNSDSKGSNLKQETDSKRSDLKQETDSEEPELSSATMKFLMGPFLNSLEKKLQKGTDLKFVEAAKATDTKIAAVKETVDNLVRSTDALDKKLDTFTTSSTIPDLIQDEISNIGIDELITNKVSSHLESVNINSTDADLLTTRISELETEFDSKLDTATEQFQEMLDEEIIELKDNIDFDHDTTTLESKIDDKIKATKTNFEAKLDSEVNDLQQSLKLLTTNISNLQHTQNIFNHNLRHSSNNTNSSTTDEKAFPILKILRKESMAKNFQDGIKNITLDNDSSISIQNFWNRFNTTLGTSIGSAQQKLLPHYHELFTKRNSKYKPSDSLLPPDTHPSYHDAIIAYNMLTTILQDHLFESTTFDSSKAPFTSNIWELNKVKYLVDRDGFQLLFEIVTLASPQLLGHRSDLTPRIYELSITSNMSLLDFHTQAVKLYQEFRLQRDDTGSSMKLVERYLSQLRLIPALDHITTKTYTDFRKTINNFGYVDGKKEFIKDKENVFEIMYNNLILHDQNPFLSLKPCPERMKQSQFLTTPNKVESVVCKTISSKIAAARITKSSFNNQHKSNSRPSHSSTSSSPHSNQRSSSYKRQNIDIKCKVCGMTNRDIIKKITKFHNCKDDNCPFRGPAFINHQQVKESIQQYNVRHGTKPTTPIIDNTYHKDPPQQPHIPKVNAVSFSSDTKEHDGQPSSPLVSSPPSDDEKQDDDDDSVYVDAFHNESDMDDELLNILEDSISNDTNPTPHVAGFNHLPLLSSESSHSTNSSNDKINPHISGLILPSSTNPTFKSSDLPLIDSTDDLFELSL